MTGYEKNGVTPFGMNTHIPVRYCLALLLSFSGPSPVQVIISRNCTTVPSTPYQYIWLGAGDIDLKLRLPMKQLLKMLNPLVLNCTEMK